MDRRPDRSRAPGKKTRIVMSYKMRRPKGPYALRFTRPRSQVIYGLCVHASGRHYVFRRDYLVLPVHLPDGAVRLLVSIASFSCANRCHGHGRYKPANLESEDGWTTYWIFNDATAPRWDKSEFIPEPNAATALKVALSFP